MMNNLDFALLLTDELRDVIERVGKETLETIGSRQDVTEEHKVMLQTGANDVLKALRVAINSLHEQATANVFDYRAQRKENET